MGGLVSITMIPFITLHVMDTFEILCMEFKDKKMDMNSRPHLILSLTLLSGLLYRRRPKSCRNPQKTNFIQIYNNKSKFFANWIQLIFGHFN